MKALRVCVYIILTTETESVMFWIEMNLRLIWCKFKYSIDAFEPSHNVFD